ncbi:MAG TPA: hypothetical protein VG308_01425 [Stellaceae bacterium]|jgi:hypothetical protein|nr:hypothetical protein [Stellaceae bacterium]
MLDLAQPLRADAIDLPEWTAAEVLDAPLPDRNRLRAVVVRLGAGRWQWTINSILRDRGELISTGIEKSAAAARDMAASELAKCLTDPLV